MKRPTEEIILAKLKQGLQLGPLKITFAQKASERNDDVDAIVYVSLQNYSEQFIVECKSTNTPRAVKDAIARIKDLTGKTRGLPMIVVPYLKEQRLLELQESGVSGVDLCGNGIINAPGRLFTYITGRPNLYPDSAPSKYAYRGKTSLVARAFLCRGNFSQLEEIQNEIERRGGDIAISTISKALKRLEEDVIVERTQDGIQLLQPEKLLSKLEADFTFPEVSKTAGFTSKESVENLLRYLPQQIEAVLAGRSSVNAYAVIGKEEVPVIYTKNIADLLERWNDKVGESARFVKFELRETKDPLVYFDIRRQNGIPYASPIQAYLECMAGDKRERETAEQIEEIIIKEGV